MSTVIDGEAGWFVLTLGVGIVGHTLVDRPADRAASRIWRRRAAKHLPAKGFGFRRVVVTDVTRRRGAPAARFGDVRAATGLDLDAAVSLLRSLPATVAEGVDDGYANALADRLRKHGATVEITTG